MFIKRAIISACTAARLGKTNQNKNLILRTFASSPATVSLKNAIVNSSTNLVRALKDEFEAQKEMVADQAEELEPQNVLQKFSNFLRENKWNVDHPYDSTLVTLRRRDEALQAEVTIKFDSVEVFNELYEENSEELDEGPIESFKNVAEMEEIDEEMQLVTLPFSIEIHRHTVPEKTLLFDCVLEGDETDNNIVIENVSVMPIDSASRDSAYLAPNYSQLDESLQESFEEFVNSLVGSGELMGFIKNYSVASETNMYQYWLNNVRSILKD